MDTALPCLHNTMVINIINAIRVRTWHANVPTSGCCLSTSEIPEIRPICVKLNHQRRVLPIGVGNPQNLPNLRDQRENNTTAT